MVAEWTAGAVDESREAHPASADVELVEVPGRPASFTDADAVAYRTTVGDPRSEASQRVVLELDGAYARAEVWADGERVGDHDVYFTPGRFELDPGPETDVVVVCRAPEDRFGGVYETSMVPPDLRTPGIWWGARLRVKPATYIADLSVTPRPHEGVIEAAVTVDTTEGVDDRVTLSLRPEGFRGGASMDRVHVQADAGERVTVTKDIDVRDPMRWWPRGFGDQNRYRLKAKLGDDSTEVLTGFCAVERDGDGLLVNGERIPARGVNLLPSDDPVADLERAVAANATLVRTHGYVPSPELHEACDELGLLLWQDLPLVGPGDVDVDRGTALASALEGRFGVHPSSAFYGVHTAPAGPWGAHFGDGFLARLRLRWRAWRTEYDRTPADAIAEAFDEGVVFPVVGRAGTSPDAADVFPGWDYERPEAVEWLLDTYPSMGGAVAAYGAAALSEVPDRESDFPWAVHDARVGSDDPEDSQAYQSRVVKTVTESLRRRGAGVTAAFHLRDPSPPGGMGLVAHDGREKAGYDALAQSLEPVQAVLDAPPSRANGVLVLNDTPDPVEGTLTWTVGDEEGEASVAVSARDRDRVTDLSIPRGTGTVRLELSTADGTVTNEYHL